MRDPRVSRRSFGEVSAGLRATLLSPRNLLALARQRIEASRLRFHIDGVDGHCLRGWVFLADGPRRRLRVAARDRMGVDVDHLADLYRADVHRAGIGSDGYCGFAIPLASLSDDASIASKEPYRRLSCGRPNRAAPARAAFSFHGELTFQLDDGAALSGWLSGSIDPGERRQILLCADGRQVAAQTASLYRRVQPSGAADGYHGFAFAFPTEARGIELIDGATRFCLHRRRVRT